MRALVPCGAPLIALTATATKSMRLDICRKLEMTDCKLICVLPDQPNIYYVNDIVADMSILADRLKACTSSDTAKDSKLL